MGERAPLAHFALAVCLCSPCVRALCPTTTQQDLHPHRPGVSPIHPHGRFPARQGVGLAGEKGERPTARDENEKKTTRARSLARTPSLSPLTSHPTHQTGADIRSFFGGGAKPGEDKGVGWQGGG
jgi:hypothetical protein